LNVIVDSLVAYAARPNRHIFQERPECSVISLYRPHIPDNEESWKVFSNDEILQDFLTNETEESIDIIDLAQNKFPKGLTPLENSFSSSDATKKFPIKEGQVGKLMIPFL
jgi:hypothetical protein